MFICNVILQPLPWILQQPDLDNSYVVFRNMVAIWNITLNAIHDDGFLQHKWCLRVRMHRERKTKVFIKLAIWIENIIRKHFSSSAFHSNKMNWRSVSYPHFTHTWTQRTHTLWFININVNKKKLLPNWKKFLNETDGTNYTESPHVNLFISIQLLADVFGD